MIKIDLHYKNHNLFFYKTLDDGKKYENNKDFGYYKCEKCNNIIYFTRDGLYYIVNRYEITSNKELTCEEHLIKNIIE